MEALATIGLVGNVLQLIDTSTKLYALTKECSSIAGAPTEVIAASKRLKLVIQTIEELDESGLARLDHEMLALKVCSDEAEKLRVFLENLTITSDPTTVGSSTATHPPKVRLASDSAGHLKWLSSKRASAKANGEKGWKAFKALRGKEKLESLQISLDRVLELIMIQQQSRVE